MTEPLQGPLRVSPPYALRDEAGRAVLLEDLTGLLVGATAPLQVWHGHRPVRLDVPAPGHEHDPAAELAVELARTGRARQTVLLPAPAPAELVGSCPPWPVPWAERPGLLAFGEQRRARVLALTAFPPVVGPDWLGEMAGCCAATVLHLQPIPTPVATRLLRRRLTSLTSTAYVQERAGWLADPQVDLAAEAARGLREQLAAGHTRLLRAQLLLAVAANTEGELDRTQQRLLTLLGAVNAQARVLRLEQGPAWEACRPGGAPLRWPWRLLDASTLAATIPLPVGPLAQPADVPAGVLAGVEPRSRVPVLHDRFRGGNPARLVVGTSGAGKSYASKLELLRQLHRGLHAVVLDPEGEFTALARAVGGVVLRVGEEPAGLDPVGLACRDQLAPPEGLAVLTSWASALLGSELDAVDLALLDGALTQLRHRAQQLPTASAGPSELLTVLTDLTARPPFAGADLPARLAPAAGGTLAELFAPNAVLADPPALVVFDLRSVPARVRPAVMSCVLSWAWTRTVHPAVPAGTRQLVVVDEAHLILDDPSAAQLLAQLARRARKYHVALEVVTQRLADFLRHPDGQAILANTATKLLLGCEEHDRHAIATGLHLTDAESQWLRPGRTGTGLLLTAQERTPVRIVGAPAEHHLASAGPR